VQTTGPQVLYFLFYLKFEDYANEIESVSNINANNIFASVLNMGVTISSYAEDTGATFPFVTVPHFEFRGRQLLELSGARYILWDVIVPLGNTTAWNDYSVANQGWVQDGLDAQRNGETASQITPYIYKYDSQKFKIKDNSFEEKVVTWQVAPAEKNPSLVNENKLSTRFEELVDRIKKVHTEVLSEFLTEGIEIETSDAFNIGSPQSYLVQPVFRQVAGGGDHRRDIVGYLAALLPWDNYFKNIVPEGTPPLLLVLQNTCGQKVTFQIDGPIVRVVSPNEDLHDPAFDDLVHHASFNTQYYNSEGERQVLS
jgi:hypothetical protein